MIILKIIFFPIWFVWWVFTAPARKKKRDQKNLERWGCELTKEQREAEEYYDKYYR